MTHHQNPIANAQPERTQEDRANNLAQVLMVQYLNLFTDLFEELRARTPELTQKHPGQWVAMYRNGDGYGYVTAPDEESLEKEVDAHGLSGTDRVFKFLDPNPPPLPPFPS